MRHRFVVLMISMLAACGDDDAPSGNTVDAGGNEGLPDSGTQSGADGGSSNDAGEGQGIKRMALPDGWREYKQILNMVDPEAVEALNSSLSQQTQGYEALAQRFYKIYPDDYDFLFFVTEDPIPEPSVSASYSAVRSSGLVGTGVKVHKDVLEYHSVAKLKGAIGVQMMDADSFPPLAHEIMHRWGADFDESFGFGKDLDYDYGNHWGSTSVFGQLGGFDASTLRCTKPAGAIPPAAACTPESNGRIRYLVGNYAGQTNSFQSFLYAPLELYLMGLVPKSEVPATFLRLTQAELIVESVRDADEEHQIVEAAGIETISFADIIARHGERRAATAEEKAYKAAFVLVSRTAASTARLEKANSWAGIFGGNMSHASWKSFAFSTGNRATMDTKLGQRRAVDDPLVPPEVKPCDVFEQDCGEELACYDYNGAPSCFGVGKSDLGEPCVYIDDCKKGLACWLTSATGGECVYLCDYSDAPAAGKSCDTLCPGNFHRKASEYALCRP